MRGTARGRAALVFLLVFALGEFFAFSVVSKTISYRRGGALEVAINWPGFLLLSAVGIVVACWCAYRTWQGGARAIPHPPDAP